MKTLAEARDQLIKAHTGSPYYSRAEEADWLATFWGDQAVFRRMFTALDLDNALELACGHGRHTAQIIGRTGHITLVDANVECIEACRKRFASHTNISYLVNSGADLRAVASNSMTAVFSYDAMVHFEPLDVISYIFEIARLLVPGGRSLLHYSNAEDNFEGYESNPGWRNFFSEKMMRAFAFRAGLQVMESTVIPWGTTSDGVTLLLKPPAS